MKVWIDQDLCTGDGLCEEICAELTRTAGPEGEAREWMWLRSPCLGLCERAPAALLQRAGDDPGVVPLAPLGMEQVTGFVVGGPVRTRTDVARSAPQTAVISRGVS